MRVTSLQIVEQLMVERLHHGRVFNDALVAGETSHVRLRRRFRVDVAHHRDAELRAGDENLPERRREDAVADQPRADVGQLRLQLGTGQGGIDTGHRRATEIRDHPLEHPIATQLLPALPADGDVPLHSLRRGGPGLACGYRYQVALDFTAGRDLFHGYRSV